MHHNFLKKSIYHFIVSNNLKREHWDDTKLFLENEFEGVDPLLITFGEFLPYVYKPKNPDKAEFRKTESYKRSMEFLRQQFLDQDSGYEGIFNSL